MLDPPAPGHVRIEVKPCGAWPFQNFRDESKGGYCRSSAAGAPGHEAVGAGSTPSEEKGVQGWNWDQTRRSSASSGAQLRYCVILPRGDLVTLPTQG